MTTSSGVGTLLKLLLLHVVPLDNGTTKQLYELEARLNALEAQATDSHAATFAPMPTPTQNSEDGQQ